MLCHALVMLCIVMPPLFLGYSCFLSMMLSFVFMVVFWLSGLGCMMLCHFLVMLCFVFMLVFRMVLGIVFMLGFVFMLVFMLFFILMKLFYRPIGPLCMMCCHVLMMLCIFMSAFFPGNSRLLSMVISFIFMMHFMIVFQFHSSLSRMVFNHLFMMLRIIMTPFLPGTLGLLHMVFRFVFMAELGVRAVMGILIGFILFRLN